VNGPGQGGLAQAERRLLARAYAEAAELLDEFAWIAVPEGEVSQDDYDAVLAQLIQLGRQRAADLDGLEAPRTALAGPQDPHAAWDRLLAELEGDGELLSPVNVTVHGSIGYWGLELLADYARLRRAEFRSEPSR
jgi:hypothetical protein